MKYNRQDLTLYNGTILHVIDLKPNRSHCYYKNFKIKKKCIIWKINATDVSAHLRPFSIGNINYLMQNL